MAEDQRDGREQAEGGGEEGQADLGRVRRRSPSPCPVFVCSPIALNVLIIEMTVKNSPTIVAILAMARIEASRKCSRGRISSSVSLAMLRRIAAAPWSAASSPATNSRLGISPFSSLHRATAPLMPFLRSVCWNTGRKSSMSVFADMFRRIRQITSAAAISDMMTSGSGEVPLADEEV